MKKTILGIGCAALLGAAPVVAQPAVTQYPSKTIRIITPNSAGSGTDNSARRLAEKLSVNLGTPVVVENIPGAGGVVGTEALIRAPKDGHTLSVVTSNHVIFPHLHKHLKFDALKDVTPIAMMLQGPLVLVARSDFIANDVKQLAALANTGKRLSMGSSGNGTVLHLVGEYLQLAGGFKMTHVPYRGAAPVVPDVVSGTVDVAFFALPTVQALVKSGKLKILGSSGKSRIPEFPEVRPISDWLPGFELDAWTAVLAPAGVDPAIVRKLNAEVNKAIISDDFRSFAISQGAVVAPMTPSAFASFLSKEYEKHGDLVKRSGATLD